MKTLAIFTRWRLIAAAALAVTMTGCAGTVVVDFAVQAQVSGRESSGRDWIAATHDIVTLPRPAGLASPFDAKQYRGPDFDWTFGTGTDGFGGDVTNRGTAPLCFRFDQAMLSTNLHPGAVKLRVAVFAHTVAGPAQWTVLGSTDPKKLNYFDPPALCFPPGRTAHITLGPDLDLLFPNRTMFNVRWPEGVAELIEKGIGNYFQIEIPIDRHGKLDQLRVRLTAQDSRARLSNF